MVALFSSIDAVFPSWRRYSVKPSHKGKKNQWVWHPTTSMKKAKTYNSIQEKQRNIYYDLRSDLGW